jgi:hypothetical protein
LPAHNAKGKFFYQNKKAVISAMIFFAFSLDTGHLSIIFDFYEKITDIYDFTQYANRDLFKN